jgi:hypothetical protein
VRVWAVRKGMVMTQASGRVVLAQAERIMAAVDTAIREAPGQVVVVHDLLDVDSYEINVHTRMSTWSVATFRFVRRVVIGVRSPLVSLAVRTVNLAVGGRYEVLESRETLLAAARREFAAVPARASVR